MKAVLILALLTFASATSISSFLDTVSTSSSNFLNGVWYGYNQKSAPPFCCIPTGVVIFSYSDGQTVMNASEWIHGTGATCPADGIAFVIPGLDASASYDQLPDKDDATTQQADAFGYTYYKNDLDFQGDWSNGTQMVLFNMTIVEPKTVINVGCQVMLSKTGSVLTLVGTALLALIASFYIL